MSEHEVNRTPATHDRRRSRIPLVLFGIAALLGLLYLALGLPLRRARTAFEERRYAEATRSLERWQRLRLRPADFEHLLAASYLAEGRSDAARPFLDRISRRSRAWFPVITPSEVGKVLISNGRYDEFLLYDPAVRRGRDGKFALYRAAANVGTGRIVEAQAIFSSIDSDDVDEKPYETIRQAIHQRRQGNYPLVFDRDGKALAVYDIANRDLVAVNRSFETIIDSRAGKLTIEAALPQLGTSNAVQTTLDSQIQSAAMFAIGPFRAALVAIDTRTNEILAIASSPGGGVDSNLAFEGRYEPGSVVKVLTTLNMFESGISPSKFFPYRCEGVLSVGGKPLFDWAKHDVVSSLNEAMATSCNTSFARVGLDLGAERTRQFFELAGFGGSADLGIFSVPLGTSRGPSSDPFDVATYSAGLQHETTNALHLAMIAAMLANDGTMTAPRLVRSQQTILGDSIPFVSPMKRTVVASVASTKPLREAMQAVVVNPRGTGRRAVVSGLPIAMKTGTSGDSAGGFDAIIIAFAPAGQPRIAVGITAENAGPAEFAGAKITRDFLAQIADRVNATGLPSSVRK